jgi:hypothetical protein
MRHFIDVTWQVTHSNPHDFNAVRFEPGVTLQIALRPVAHVVADAVEFNRRPRGRAVEI